MQNTIEIFSDINKKNPMEQSRVINAEAIKNSVKNILNIRGKQLPFEFGYANLPAFLFEIITNANAFSLRNLVLEILSKEPRIDVSLRETDVIPDILNNRYEINIVYKIKATGVKQETSFSV